MKGSAGSNLPFGIPFRGGRDSRTLGGARALAGSLLVACALAAPLLVASCGGDAPSEPPGTGEPGFQIDLRLLGEFTGSQEAAFERARERWEEVVRGDLEAVFVDTDPDDCIEGSPALEEEVDDLLIFARTDSIDGEGGVVAQAGPCILRDGNDLPVVGVIKFDEADIDRLEEDGVLEDVILHEMGHVLGFGTIWIRKGLLADPALEGGEDPHFTGPAARQAFDDAGGEDYDGEKVPVEDEGGQGTADSHWRQSVFEDELMTSTLSATANPLSAVTVASLQDLGYEVNPAAADPYELPSSPLDLAVGREAADGGHPGDGVHLGDDIWRGPLYRLWPDGTLERVERRRDERR